MFRFSFSCYHVSKSLNHLKFVNKLLNFCNASFYFDLLSLLIFLKKSWKSWPTSPWIFLHIWTKFIVQLFDHEQNDVATSDFKKIPSTLSFI